MKAIKYLFLLGMLLVIITGCGQVSNVNVTETLATANDKMAGGDIDGAYADYQDVLSADSGNAEANFGAALIGVMNVAVDSNTRTLAGRIGFNNMPTSLNQLFAEMSPEASAVKMVNYAAFINMAVTPEITPSDVQDYIKTTLIPALDIALGRLAYVEANQDFTYLVTNKISGVNQNREIDLGEIYSLDLLGSLLKGMLHEAIAYNWDYSTSSPLSETNFGTLKTSGAVEMAAARDAYARSMAKWIAGINFIDAETDDQADDCIPKFSDQNLKNQLLDYFAMVKNSLENGATVIPLDASNSITVNFKQYYSTPVADWKVYVNGVSNNFPSGYDFTLNGLFPGMTTKANWETLANNLR